GLDVSVNLIGIGARRAVPHERLAAQRYYLRRGGINRAGGGGVAFAISELRVVINDQAGDFLHLLMKVSGQMLAAQRALGSFAVSFERLEFNYWAAVSQKCFDGIVRFVKLGGEM